MWIAPRQNERTVDDQKPMNNIRKGKDEGNPITEFVVEDRADRVFVSFKTLHEAIDSVKRSGDTPHVARVRLVLDHQTSRRRSSGRQPIPERRSEAVGRLCNVGVAPNSPSCT